MLSLATSRRETAYAHTKVISLRDKRACGMVGNHRSRSLTTCKPVCKLTINWTWSARLTAIVSAFHRYQILSANIFSDWTYRTEYDVPRSQSPLCFLNCPENTKTGPFCTSAKSPFLRVFGSQCMQNCTISQVDVDRNTLFPSKVGSRF